MTEIGIKVRTVSIVGIGQVARIENVSGIETVTGNGNVIGIGNLTTTDKDT